MKKKIIKRKIILTIFLFLLVFIVLSIIFVDNETIIYENFNFSYDTNDGLDKGEIKIIHLSDLHFPDVMVNTDELLETIKDEKPDFIAITGDIIDRSAKVKESGVFEFIDKLKKIAPIYYVNGNHENDNEGVNDLYVFLENNGVTILRNESINVIVKNKEITIIGLIDNAQYNPNYFEGIKENNNYKLLLAHHPEKWKDYISASYSIRPNLILSGHAHGGQIRLPFVGGLVAPNQGLFPKYDAGLFESNDSNTKMIVSRGIGNSAIPYRFNNNPHVPIIKITI